MSIMEVFSQMAWDPISRQHHSVALSTQMSATNYKETRYFVRPERETEREREREEINFLREI